MHGSTSLVRAFALALLAMATNAACDEQAPVDARACFPLPSVTPRLRGGWDANGVSLQGREAARTLAPRAGDRENQGIYLGLADLDGVRLELADSGIPVHLVAGRLAADGVASLHGMELRATTRDMRHFMVRIGEGTIDSEGVELLVDGQPVCEPGHHGVFVDGRWGARSEWIAAPGALTYACGDGVIAKCVAWGYAPWIVGSDVHQSCTRLARADYCGDGTPWTMEGTTIDAYDRIGVQRRVTDAGDDFEAAWGPDGAVCVAHSRWTIVDGEGDVVMPPCFAELPRCTDLDDDAAADAVLANASRPREIDTCE